MLKLNIEQQASILLGFRFGQIITICNTSFLYPQYRFSVLKRVIDSLRTELRRAGLSLDARQDALGRWQTLKEELSAFGVSRPIDATLFVEVAQSAMELNCFVEREFSRSLQIPLLLGLQLGRSERSFGSARSNPDDVDARAAALELLRNPHLRPWHFENSPQIDELLNELGLRWEDVCGELNLSLIDSSSGIEVEGSQYKQPWDCWTLIEDALFTLQEEVTYLGVIFGPNENFPVRRQGFESSILLTPTCFKLLKRYVRAGEKGLLRPELEEQWGSIGSDDADNPRNALHTANSKLCKALQQWKLKVESDRSRSTFRLAELCES